MWNLIKEFIPRIGINRYIKRDVLYGLPSVQGLGLKDIYLTQGISHIVEIIEHLWKKSITGHFITISLECLRLELGLNINILQSKYSNYQKLILTRSWIEQTWKFMEEQHISLDIDVPIFLLLRESDRNIMQAILNNPRLTDVEIKIVN